MVFGLLAHSNNEHNLKDIYTDDNLEDQEDDNEHVDYEEDTAKGNDSRDIRKLSKRSQSSSEVRTSRSLGHTTKKKSAQDGPNHVCRQEMTILYL